MGFHVSMRTQNSICEGTNDLIYLCSSPATNAHVFRHCHPTHSNWLFETIC